MKRQTPTLVLFALLGPHISRGDELSGKIPRWEPLESGLPKGIGLRGIATFSDEVAWASGVGSSVVRTLDGGKTWEKVRKWLQISTWVLFLKP